MTTRKSRDCNRALRIGLYDVETAPLLGYSWQMWDTNIIEVVQPSFMLSFSWQWLDEDKIKNFKLPDYPTYKRNKSCDKPLITELRNYLDEADVVIGHNADQFDNKKSNARFLVHGLRPPSPYKTIDTLKIARKHFKLESNRLDSLAQVLGIGRKLPHEGKATWLGCMNGDRRSWKIIGEYNDHDVYLLKGVYEKLKPWASTHPDLRVFDGRCGCPVCLSANIQKRGVRVAKTKRYERLHCQDCGHWFSGEIIK